MKITLDPSDKKAQYPKLMSHTKFPNLVLYMIAPSKGVVVSEDKGIEFLIGRYSETWNMSVFKDYNGRVILEND